MTQVRAFSRLTSSAVIVALVAATVLTVCCAMTGIGIMATNAPMASALCPLGSHGQFATSNGAVEQIGGITPLLLAVVAAGVLLMAFQASEGPRAAAAAVLPPPGDPRHGRIRV